MASVTVLALISLMSAPAPPLPSPPAPPSPGYRLASHLAAGLLADPEALPPTSTYRVDVTVEGGPERLGAYMADQVEGAVARTVSGTTRTRRSDVTHLIDLQLQVRRARVDATARLVRLPRSIWERLRLPQGEVLSTTTATAEMDLELRILAGARTLGVKLKSLRLVDLSGRSDPTLVSSPVLDMVHADLDGDGLREVVVLQADRLLTVRWRDGRLDLVDEASLDSMPPARARLRQPMGRLVVVTDTDGRSSLLVASSERGGVSLWRYGRDRWRLVAQSPVDGHWPLYALGPGQWLVRGDMSAIGLLDNEVVSQVERHADGYAARPIQPMDFPFHALRAHGVYEAATPSWSPRLVMSAPDRTLTVWRATAPEAALVIEEAGDVALVCDLDANGTPELIHTSAALQGTDRLTLLELSGPRGMRRRWTRSTPLPVTSLVSADLDEDGFSEVLVAGWGGDQGALHLITPHVTE